MDPQENQEQVKSVYHLYDTNSVVKLIKDRASIQCKPYLIATEGAVTKEALTAAFDKMRDSMIEQMTMLTAAHPGRFMPEKLGAVQITCIIQGLTEDEHNYSFSTS